MIGNQLEEIDLSKASSLFRHKVIDEFYKNTLTIHCKGTESYMRDVAILFEAAAENPISVFVLNYQRKNLPSRPPAKLFTIPPPSALLAKVEAWLNLSHREKATVFVIVKMRAIPAFMV